MDGGYLQDFHISLHSIGAKIESEGFCLHPFMYTTLTIALTVFLKQYNVQLWFLYNQGKLYR